MNDKPSARGPDPDLASFAEFMAAVDRRFPRRMHYEWSQGKERSSDWIVERVPPGSTGVDVGGTEYLCHQLADRGCQVTFYDLVRPRSFTRHVQDDMFNIRRHFEPRSLDFVVTRHTLEHSFVPLYQLWAYNQLLRDDGLLMVTVPCYHERWVWMPTHFHAVPPDSWHMLFYRAGFDIDAFTIGRWRPRGPAFVEHRFQLRLASRELRLRGRPDLTLHTEDESLPGGRAPRDERRGLPPLPGQGRAGRAAMRQASRLRFLRPRGRQPKPTA